MEVEVEVVDDARLGRWVGGGGSSSGELGRVTAMTEPEPEPERGMETMKRMLVGADDDAQ